MQSKELTHWKRLWCWEGLGAGGEGDARGWDGWVASLTRWTWVWVNSGSWWWTGRPGVCDSWGCKESDTTEQLNWTELNQWTYIVWMPQVFSISHWMNAESPFCLPPLKNECQPVHWAPGSSVQLGTKHPQHPGVLHLLKHRHPQNVAFQTKSDGFFGSTKGFFPF